MRLAVLLVSLAFAAPALADDAADPMAGVIGNTIVVVDAKGIESHTHYYADHTFDGVAPAFDYHYKGTWTLTDGQLCSTFDPPPPGVVNPRCNPAGTLHVGDSWTSPDGGKGQLVAGIN
jgi:hypothetical protein